MGVGAAVVLVVLVGAVVAVVVGTVVVGLSVEVVDDVDELEVELVDGAQGSVVAEPSPDEVFVVADGSDVLPSAHGSSVVVVRSALSTVPSCMGSPWKVPLSLPSKALVMKRRQMSAGNDPPVNARPWTLSMNRGSSPGFPV